MLNNTKNKIIYSMLCVVDKIVFVHTQTPYTNVWTFLLKNLQIATFMES